MYEEKSRKLNIDWKSLTIKMLILLAVLFVVLWVVALVGKGNKPKKVSNLTANLKTMQSAANEYFTGSRLPENVNGKKKVTLGEMFDSKLLIEFKDQNNNSCNTTESYAEATKISEDNYTIKVKLVCGKEEDYVIDTVTIKTDNIIVDNNPSEDDNNGDEPNDIPVIDDNNNNSNGGGNNNSGANTIVNKPSTSGGNSKVNVSAIYINYKKIYVNVGASKSVMTVIYPTNATDKSVTWSSSNTAVATVNNGVITGVKEGNATITASAGGKSTTMEVQVLGNSSNNSNGNNNSNNGSNNGSNNNTTCQYGVKDYANYTPAYLISGNCAGAKSDYYNSTYSNQASTIGANEYKKLVQEIATLKANTGANVYVEAPVYTAVYNKANTGFVGYQIKFVAKLRQTYSAKSIYEYYLNTDGSRKVILDNRNSLTNSNNNSNNNNNNSNSNNTTVAVSGITLNLTNFSLTVGDTYNLRATVTPYNASNKTVTWSSSNSGVATVVNGKVTALKEGSATITAKAGNKTATAYVTVKTQNYLTLANSNVSLNVDDTYNISYSSNATASFRSSNSSIATVDSRGRITAKRSGDAIIYVTSNNIQKSVNVTVKDNEYLTVSNTKPEINVGETKYIDYDSNKTVSFRSSDTSIVTVDSRGKMTAKSVGSATIYVTAGNLQRRVFVNVVNNNPVSAGYKTVFANTSGGRQIDFNVVDPQVRVGSTIRLYAAANYFVPMLNWYSGNPNVATVDNNGNVTGKSVGTAEIFAMDERGVASSYITVMVVSTGTNKGTTNTTIYTNTSGGRKIDFNVTNPKVRIGSSLQMNPTANYFNPRFTWISTNDNIASVDANGKVIGLKEGTTTIMAIDNGYAASEIVVEVTR